MKIVVFDPALENVNAGDEIISTSVQSIPGLAVGDAERLTTHRLLRKDERRLVSEADLVVLSGTNAISSRMERFRQWLIDPDLAIRMRNKLLLVGVGWWQYQDEPNLYTRNLLRIILTDKLTHSTRDAYTNKRITALGFSSLMTGCPTMWNLEERAQRPLGRNDRAVITITDYKRSDPEADRRWISVVKEKYSEVGIVGMGPGDGSYFRELGIPDVVWKGAGVSSLDAALPGADFVGTRLHAGVRALQCGQPALILAVDNRAFEISKDSGLNVESRWDTLAIHRSIHGRVQPSPLSIDYAAIRKWREAFGAHAGLR
ncbi:polysaccharide pyruvyl transferase family protein [Dietzia natronolimnaea]|uniref:polysaccharide pyruvyl transferase family protein n=1 Tax=Dietzia natronolimnaea TaxID=161920 RepID=UPI001595F1BE|nr:polysaccharide pyruvyl transferase family protein [Dietzia natronolimnaea]